MSVDKGNQLAFGKGNPFGTQAKLFLHKKRMAEYLTTGDTKVPVFMEVGLTNRCNENCFWCITENGRDNIKGAQLEIEPLKQFLEDFAEMGGKAVTFCGQGEPTMYPDFIEAAEKAKEVGLQLGLMSNGVYSSKKNHTIGSLFEWARFSVDTIDAAKYKEWKELDGVSVIFKNVEALRDYPIRLGVNCNVGMNITVEHARQLIKWVDNEQGISYLQFRPILPRYYKKDEVRQLNEEVWKFLDEHRDNPKIVLSDDKRQDILEGTDLFNFRSCEGHYFEPILDAEGNIKVCTYHPKNPKLSFGNIYENRFPNIWKSQQRQDAINYVRNMNYCKECQACCKLAEPNKLLDFLNHPEEIQDINFL